jgi:hypothetical protein
MTFDAGTVSGNLKFDLSEYTRSMIESESLMQAFPAIVLEFMENPLLATIETFKESADAFGEMVQEIADDAQKIGLEAEKAGTSVEYFSEMARLAATVGISDEQLSTGFKFIQKNAVDATQGVKEAAESFQALGLSLDWVRDHLNDTQGLMEAVRDRISEISNVSERTRLSMEIMGRAGADLGPLLAIPKDEAQELISIFKELGVVETDESVAGAQKFKLMEVLIGDAWEGIKMALAEPIFQYVAGHIKELKADVVEFSHEARQAIPAAFDVIKGSALVLEDLLLAIVGVMGTIAHGTDLVHLTHGAGADFDAAYKELYKGVKSTYNFQLSSLGIGDGGEAAKDDTPKITLPDTSLGDFSAGLGGIDLPTGGGGSGRSDEAGGSGGHFDGIMQASVLSASPSFYSGLGDTVRPILYEVAGFLASAIAAAEVSPTTTADSSPAAPRPAAASPQGSSVEIQAINVAGLDAASTAAEIAAKITPQIRGAFQRQQQALDSASVRAKVARAVIGGGNG